MNLKRQIGIDIKNLYLKIMLNNMGIDIRRKRTIMVGAIRTKMQILDGINLQTKDYYIWKDAVRSVSDDKAYN